MSALCPHCSAPVIPARIKGPGGGYKLLNVEKCEDGDGDLAIFPTLFDDGHPPIAELVCNGTSYRAHPPHSSTLAFSAQGRSAPR